MFLNRLLYRSDLALTGSTQEIEDQLAALLARAQDSNRTLGLTGALLLASGVFIQVLEGPAKVVETTFERICRDLRHRRVRLLELAAVEARVFADWSMARVPMAGLYGSGPMQASAEAARVDASMASATVEMMRGLLRTGGLHRDPHQAWTPD